MGARGQSCLCGPQEAGQALGLQTAPAQAWEMAFFPCVLQLGPFIIGKKKKEKERERENDQASRLENKET